MYNVHKFVHCTPVSNTAMACYCLFTLRHTTTRTNISYKKLMQTFKLLFKAWFLVQGIQLFSRIPGEKKQRIVTGNWFPQLKQNWHEIDVKISIRNIAPLPPSLFSVCSPSKQVKQSIVIDHLNGEVQPVRSIAPLPPSLHSVCSPSKQVKQSIVIDPLKGEVQPVRIILQYFVENQCLRI